MAKKPTSLHVQPAFAGQSICSYSQVAASADTHLLGTNPPHVPPSFWDGKMSVKAKLTTTLSSLCFVIPKTGLEMCHCCVFSRFNRALPPLSHTG